MGFNSLLKSKWKKAEFYFFWKKITPSCVLEVLDKLVNDFAFVPRKSYKSACAAKLYMEWGV